MYTLTHSEPFLLSQAAIQLAFFLVLIIPILLIVWSMLTHRTSKAVTCEGGSIDTVKLGWLDWLKGKLNYLRHWRGCDCNLGWDGSTAIEPTSLTKHQSQYLAALASYNKIACIWTSFDGDLNVAVNHHYSKYHAFRVIFHTPPNGDPRTFVCYFGVNRCETKEVEHNTIDHAFNELLARWDARINLELQR